LKEICMPTVTKVFDSHWRAIKALTELEAAGIPSSKISMLVNKYVSDKAVNSDDASAAETGAGVGAVVGGAAGLLAGLGVVAIPGLGPIIAAGWLASTGIGAVAGGATGGIVGALIDSDVPENHAHVYSEAIRRGGTLLSVRTDDARAPEVKSILDRYDPVNPDSLSEDYRKTGWGRFDPDAEPYTISEAELERRRGLR
jgi:hypothetical protein